MDYSEIDRISMKLERDIVAQDIEALEKTISENEPEKIEERVEDEKEKTDVPEPSFEAAEKIASQYEKLIKMAKQVKSSKLSAEAKKEYLAEIKTAANDLKIKKSDLKKILNGDVTRLVKQTQKLNNITKTDEGTMTLKNVINEMKKHADEYDIKVDFPAQLLNKTLGNCTSAELIKLGPMIANLIDKYEKVKEAAENAKIQDDDAE